MRCDASDVTASRREPAVPPTVYATVFPSGSITGYTTEAVESTSRTRCAAPPRLETASIPASDPTRTVSLPVQQRPRMPELEMVASSELGPPSAEIFLTSSPSVYAIHLPSGEKAGCHPTAEVSSRAVVSPVRLIIRRVPAVPTAPYTRRSPCGEMATTDPRVPEGSRSPGCRSTTTRTTGSSGTTVGRRNAHTKPTVARSATAAVATNAPRHTPPCASAAARVGLAAVVVVNVALASASLNAFAFSKRSAGSFSSALSRAAETLAGTDFRYCVTGRTGSAMIFMMICCAEPPRCGG